MICIFNQQKCDSRKLDEENVYLFAKEPFQNMNRDILEWTAIEQTIKEYEYT